MKFYSAPIMHVGGPLDGTWRTGPVVEFDPDLSPDTVVLVPIPDSNPRRFEHGHYVFDTSDGPTPVLRWHAHNRGDNT